jgi:hypothetical protein
MSLAHHKNYFTVSNSEHVSVHGAFETGGVLGWGNVGLILWLAFLFDVDSEDPSDGASQNEFGQYVDDANVKGNTLGF